MAKIGQQQMPRAPMWPWGGPRSVRDKLVNRAQIDSKKSRKKGDPKNPSLASAALLDFIGPAHSADELRLPLPPMPRGHDADVEGMLDRPNLSSAAERLSEMQQTLLERSLGAVRAPPDRMERLKSLLQREAQMLHLVGSVAQEIEEIEQRRKEESASEGY